MRRSHSRQKGIHELPDSGGSRTPSETQGVLAALVESAEDAITTQDFDGTIRSWNPGAARLYGYSAEDAIGRPISMVVAPGERDEMPFVVDRLRHGERVEPYETVHMRKNGQRVFVSVSSFLTRSADGEVIGISCIARDNTVHREAEDALSHALSREMASRAAAEIAEDRAKSLLEMAPDGIVIVTGDGSISFVNGQTEMMFGYERNELIGKPVEVLLPERFRSVHVGHRIGYIAAPRIRPMGVGLELYGLRADGTEFPVEIALSPMRTGEELTVTAIVRDITERKRVENSLRASEENYRTLVENVPQAIFWKDRDMVYVSCNRNFADGLGIQPEEIAGKTDYDFFPKELADKYRGDDRKLVETGQAIELDEAYTHGGRERVVHTVKTPLLDSSGQVKGILGIFWDITDRKRAEEEIQRLNDDLKRRAMELEAANRELEAFSYSVSHDLRSPLRSIDGFSQALLEDYFDKLEPEAQDDLRRVRAATQRMGQLIDDLLMLSRLTRSEMRREQVDLSSIARDIASELSRTAPTRCVEFDIQPGLVADGDPRLLRIALENLLGNSWKFTGKRPEARIEFGATEQDGEKVFYIRDNGAGFDMAYAGALFAPFQRLHRAEEFAGTGIGLAMVQRIIRRHGGQIWAEGVVDQGATFRFRI